MNYLKKLSRMMLTILAVVLIVSACAKQPNIKDPEPENKDAAIAFAKEYNDLNGKTNPNNGKEYKTLEVKNENPIVLSSFAEINSLLKSGTGVIYLGFPECPWCRTLLPVLLDVADQEYINTIYYLNVKELRDAKKLDEAGKVVTEKEGAEGYAEFLTLMDSHLDVYDGLEDPSIKRLYVPAVIFVKDGDVKLFHVGTVDSQEDPYQPLTTEQYQELYDMLKKATQATLRQACDTEEESKAC